MTALFTVGLFQNTIRNATPVVLAAMGGLFTEHAGIMNIGMDGMILIGAFVAVVFSFLFASAPMGVLFAVIIGIAIGLFFALFVVKLKADEFVIGTTVNIFAGGVTVYLLRSVFHQVGTWVSKDIKGLAPIDIPILKDIPVIGEVLSGYSLFVYLSWVFVILVWIFLYRTPYGFWIRAAGEHPSALETAGIDPVRMKFLASVLCGIFCGLAGAHLSLGYLNCFTEGMSASRGFIAFACVVFGMANPPKVFGAALLFGFLQALGLRLQSVGVPSDLTAAVPYLTTVLMLVYITVSANTKKRNRAKKEMKAEEAETAELAEPSA
ncbi:MAG: ABC transporter permease [Firmicutes bacterium]|nr:ABC transporter permease [Bacillota bacterium]